MRRAEGALLIGGFATALLVHTDGYRWKFHHQNAVKPTRHAWSSQGTLQNRIYRTPDTPAYVSLRADLHLATRYHFDVRFALEIFAEVFNLFNRRAPLAVVSAYTFDDVEPIAGGTVEDLDHARATDGQPVRENPEYGEPLVSQAPFGASLGIRLLF